MRCSTTASLRASATLALRMPARAASRNHAFEFEAAKQIRLLLVRACEQASFCSRQLGKQFPELTKLDEGGAGVIAEIPLGQRPKAHELDIVLGKKSEVCTCDRRITHKHVTGALTKVQLLSNRRNKAAKLHNLKEKVLGYVSLKEVRRAHPQLRRDVKLDAGINPNCRRTIRRRRGGPKSDYSNQPSVVPMVRCSGALTNPILQSNAVAVRWRVTA